MPYSAKGRRAFFLLIVTILAVFALTGATFAWMSISSAPAVTNLALTVISDSALELSSDADGAPAGDWSSLMDMAEAASGANLRPVTYVASEDAFYLPRYGHDGRVASAVGTRLTDDDGALLPAFAAANGENGYLYVCDFWIRATTANCLVAFTPPAEREDGELGGGTYLVGEPVWDADAVCHKDGGSGAQYAVRMALRVDPIDDMGEENDAVTVLYEPNADGGAGLRETMSVEGNGLLQGDHLLLRQSVSTWTETDPVLRDTVLYTPGDFIDGNKVLFPLWKDHARHVTLYIWLEGQDADCTNAISEGRILANVQFMPMVLSGGNAIRPD